MFAEKSTLARYNVSLSCIKLIVISAVWIKRPFSDYYRFPVVSMRVLVDYTEPDDETSLA